MRTIFVLCSHSIIASYVIFIPSCTTLEVRICVQSLCIILLLRHKHSASLQNRHNWCQLRLHIAHCPSRTNGGALVLAPMVALPFWRVLTFVCPTPVPPMSHVVHPPHPSHVVSNQPVHRDPSRANGGSPVLELPLWRALMPVRPNPVPPTPHSVHPYHPFHPCSNQPMNTTMCTHPAIVIQFNPADPIDPI